jgi:hypothetical protein
MIETKLIIAITHTETPELIIRTVENLLAPLANNNSVTGIDIKEVPTPEKGVRISLTNQPQEEKEGEHGEGHSAR